MNLAPLIDHTVLKADCTLQDVEKVCAEAMQYGFFSVCVPPYYVKDAADRLKNSPVKTITVIGFPMGYSTTFAKVEEIKKAIDDGAAEVDGVINFCAVKSANWNFIKSDIESMARAVHLKGKVIKIILEPSLLTLEELSKLCRICSEVGPDFVKTSTGFLGSGATVQQVRTLNELLLNAIPVKASGGIRSREDAIRLVEAGAKRLGCSASVQIVQ